MKDETPVVAGFPTACSETENDVSVVEEEPHTISSESEFVREIQVGI
jgi:hypothetical protein